MKTTIEFFEVQKQTQKWVWFMVMFLLLMNVYVIFQQVILGIPFGNHPAPVWILFLIGFVIMLLVAGLFFLRLETHIDEKGVSFRFFPLHRGFRTIEWHEIKKAYVRIYHPLKEYGGWGIRTSFIGNNGKAFNMAGNVGLQLELKDGKRILIGTQKGTEISKLLNAINLVKA
ncbi:MAG TPA: DUF6141 family protein [Bacteroidales bacterium]|nr:DUF6141 family protein [Bacteroidales bacterium]